MKNIIDVLDDTSVAIYEEKRGALESNDAETKMRVLEGRDLMSVMCTCAHAAGWVSSLMVLTV